MAADRAITSDDKTYKFLAASVSITDQRDELASEIIALLNGAAFGNKPIDDADVDGLIERARKLVNEAEDLAERGE